MVTYNPFTATQAWNLSPSPIIKWQSWSDNHADSRSPRVHVTILLVSRKSPPSLSVPASFQSTQSSLLLGWRPHAPSSLGKRTRKSSSSLLLTSENTRTLPSLLRHVTREKKCRYNRMEVGSSLQLADLCRAGREQLLALSELRWRMSQEQQLGCLSLQET